MRVAYYGLNSYLLCFLGNAYFSFCSKNCQLYNNAQLGPALSLDPNGQEREGGDMGGRQPDLAWLDQAPRRVALVAYRLWPAAHIKDGKALVDSEQPHKNGTSAANYFNTPPARSENYF